MTKARRRDDPREKLSTRLMALAAEKPWEEISLSDVADRAGVSLAQFRDFFPSKGAVLGGFSRRIDKIVLDGTTATSQGRKRQGPAVRRADAALRRHGAL